MAESKTVPRKPSIPDWETNWVKVKQSIPDGLFANWDETALDKINIAWQRIPEISERVTRLGRAISIEGLPQKEVEYASESLGNSVEDAIKFREGIQRIADGEKLDWEKEIEVLGETGYRLSERESKRDDQATALLEAIAKLKGEGKLPENYEQLLAQHGIAEILSMWEYRVYDYSGAESGEEVEDRSTVDGTDDEKTEIYLALKKRAWTKEEAKAARQGHLAIRRIIRGDNNVPVDLEADEQKLWDAALNDEGTTRNSGLYLLDLTEVIFSTIQENGGFDIDIHDYIEEDE